MVGESKDESGLECLVARGGGRPPAGLVRTDEGEDVSSPETQKSLTQGPMAVASAETTSASSLTQGPMAGEMVLAVRKRSRCWDYKTMRHHALDHLRDQVHGGRGRGHHPLPSLLQ